MSQQEASDSRFSKWIEASGPLDDDLEIVRLSAAQMPAMNEARAAIARQLNGPLTALLLYMGELKQRSHQSSQDMGNQVYLQQLIENALAQTERVCAIMKRIAGPHEGAAAVPAHKPLTKREREVLSLISEGCSSKQGALRMRIGPRTFESHRAAAMRKLGARNTAELVRAALLHVRAV